MLADSPTKHGATLSAKTQEILAYTSEECAYAYGGFISHYINDVLRGSYEPLNDYYAEQARVEVEHLARGIDAMMEPAGMELTLWRGDSIACIPKVGQIHTDRAFASTSLLRPVAEKFVQQHHGLPVIWQLHAAPDTPCIDIAALSAKLYPDSCGLARSEQEVLLERDSRWLVTRVEQLASGTYLITADVLH